MTLNQNPDTATYSFDEHRHRYAVWIAARAVQRSFTTTDKIAAAIEATTLRQFAENRNYLSLEEYDKQQAQWCYKIIEAFDAPLDCSYGRAAKIIAIYLKTAIILPFQGNTMLCEVIHPPIDSILLNNLIKYRKLRDLRGKRWTGFTSSDYWNIVDIIRTSVGVFNWRLEAFWQPQLENKINI